MLHFSNTQPHAPYLILPNMQLSHKGALHRQRSVGGRIGCYRSSCDVILGLITRLTGTLGTGRDEVLKEFLKSASRTV